MEWLFDLVHYRIQFGPPFRSVKTNKVLVRLTEHPNQPVSNFFSLFDNFEYLHLSSVCELPRFCLRRTRRRFRYFSIYLSLHIIFNICRRITLPRFHWTARRSYYLQLFVDRRPGYGDPYQTQRSNGIVVRKIITVLVLDSVVCDQKRVGSEGVSTER